MHRGNEKRTLFDIVNRDDGQRFALRAATSHARVPGERCVVPGQHASLHPAGTETDTLFGRDHLF
jgi:hypothetical protein